MDEEYIRELIQEAIWKLLEEESGFATTDVSGVGGGETSGVSSDTSYIYRVPTKKVEKRPLPNLVDCEECNTKKKKKKLK